MNRLLLLSSLLLPLAACSNLSESDDAKEFNRTLSLQGVTFHVETAYTNYMNRLSIIPRGLKIDNSPTRTAIDGLVTGAEVADLNADGSPEIYIYITSAGKGSYGSVLAYATNNKKSMTPISVPLLNRDRKNSEGYLGHDEFSVVENSLARRFPIYQIDDSIGTRTGKTRQLQYKLEPSEANWILRLDNVTEF